MSRRRKAGVGRISRPQAYSRRRARFADRPAPCGSASTLRLRRVTCTSTERSKPAPVRLAKSSRLITSPRAGGQNAQQRHFGFGQAHHRAIALQFPARAIEGEGAKTHDLQRLAAIGDGAAQDGVDAQRQFGRFEGLGDIIVGADRKAANAIFRHAARGQQHDRHFRALAHALGQREAIFDRHHHVEDEEVEIHRRQELARTLGVRRRRHPRAGLGQIAFRASRGCGRRHRPAAGAGAGRARRRRARQSSPQRPADLA